MAEKNERLDFCTSLAISGFPKLVALINSLDKVLFREYLFWILCEEEKVAEKIEGLGNSRLRIVLLSELEESHADLLSVKKSRDAFEYNCTLRPIMLLYLLELDENINWLTYVDTDLYFFADPTEIYEQAGSSSVLLSPHRLSAHSRAMGIRESIVGKFNAGWIAFRNDSRSREVLEWWGFRCIEWCFRYPVPGKFGEQKYLDSFPEISTGVESICHQGVNVAPWNMTDASISRGQSDQLLINGFRLIFFHFHGLRLPGESSFKVEREQGFDTYQLTNPHYVVPRAYKSLVYEPYIKSLSLIIGRHPENNVDRKRQRFFLVQSLGERFTKKTLIQFKSTVLYIILSLAKYVNYSSKELWR